MSMIPVLLMLFNHLPLPHTSAWYGQPLASLWGDILFVATTGRHIINPMYYGTFDEERKSIQSPAKLDNPIREYKSYQAKLEIRKDRLLLFTGGSEPFIFPTYELPCLEESRLGEKLTQWLGYENQSALTNRSRCSHCRLLFPKHRKPDVAVPAWIPPQPEFGGIPTDKEGIERGRQGGVCATCPFRYSTYRAQDGAVVPRI